MSSHTPATNDYDRGFLMEAYDHLMHDVRVAKACGGKSVKPELLQFCDRMRLDQKKEQEQVAEWLKTWYSDEPHPDQMPLWLENQNGDVFAQYFLKGMLEGHRELAKRAQDCSKNAKHPELAAFCQEIALHRTEEANTLERWNCQWFKKDCR